MTTKTIITNSPEETMALAEKIARSLERGSFIALEGELGAGKTVFVKGLARGLGVKEALCVNSPSFVIIKKYSGGKMDLYHFDVYRLDQNSFLDTLDYNPYFYGKGLTAVEWADRIKDVFPAKYLEVIMRHAGPTRREIVLNAVGEDYEWIVNEADKGGAGK